MSVVECIDAFNRSVSGTGAEYSDPALNAVLASGTKFLVQLRVTQAAGTNPTITVKMERSNDGLTWTDKHTFFNAVSLASGVSYDQDTGTVPGGCFARLSVQLGGTSPSAQVQVLVALRDASVFSPSSLDGLLLWLRADLGITLNGSAVSAWADQSGRGITAVQATGSKQPAYTSSSLNGYPGLDFDGSTDCLRIATMTYGGTEKLTGAFVARDTATAVAAIFEGAAGSANNRIWEVYANSVAAGELEVRDAGQNLENGGRFTEPLTSTRRIIFTIDRTISGGVGTLEMRVWRDGVEQALTQVGTGNPTGAFEDVALNIGARDDGSALFWPGTLHELALWNRILSTSEIGRVDDYMKTFWEL